MTLTFIPTTTSTHPKAVKRKSVQTRHAASSIPVSIPTQSKRSLPPKTHIRNDLEEHAMNKNPPEPVAYPHVPESSTLVEESYKEHVSRQPSRRSFHKEEKEDPIINEEDITPQKPPIPVPHPDEETKSIKPARTPQLDPALIVDPRLRLKLALPPSNPKLMRPKDYHLGHKTEDRQMPITQPNIVPTNLDRPTANSSKFIQNRIDKVKQDRFDPVQAVAELMIKDREAVRRVQTRVTAQSLNIDRNTTQYSNLTPINTHWVHQHSKSRTRSDHIARMEQAAGEPIMSTTSGPEPASKRIQRAKKSVSQAWLDARDTKMNAEEFKPKNLEMDTISIPYPQISDDPFANGPDAPRLTMGSLELNLEDWNRLMFYEKPVRCQDFDTVKQRVQS
ncbi:hypothetical protein SpCBS45565_g04662 [Spizellomyces sp. 'palustris']|nr:hypothetical protein SpCBS45565_g04662 [Spizellomyces sp. 'palustris']